MKILIVDDERLARQRLYDLLHELDPELELVEAENGEQALDVVNAGSVDIVLLDIRMPVMDGLEAARHLASLDNPPAIVFTTAYQDHAMQAFEANAVDYLLKPIRPERLHQGIAKASVLSQAKLDRLQETDATASVRKNLSISSQGRIELIPVDEIICFYAEQKYVSVYLEDREILTDESLKKLESEFSGQFLRIHRNALVAVQYIEALERDDDGNSVIKLRGLDRPMIISRRHLKAVKEQLRNSS